MSKLSRLSKFSKTATDELCHLIHEYCTITLECNKHILYIYIHTLWVGFLNLYPIHILHMIVHYDPSLHAINVKPAFPT